MAHLAGLFYVFELQARLENSEFSINEYKKGRRKPGQETNNNNSLKNKREGFTVIGKFSHS